MHADIVLSVTRGGPRVRPVPGHGAGASEGGRSLAQSLVAQPKFGSRCHFCWFPFGNSVESVEVHHLDGDHGNDHPDNLVPVCALCHDPFHLDLVPMRHKGNPGHLVFLPELSQVRLNQLLAVVFFAIANGAAVAEVVGDKVSEIGRSPLRVSPHQILSRLAERAALAERGRPGASDPYRVAKLLRGLDAEAYAQRETLLAGLRYLPAYDSYKTRCVRWAAHGESFGRLAMDTWVHVAGVN